MTDHEALAAASRRERELYGELVAAYEMLAGVLGDAPGDCDMDALMTAQARADVAAAALYAVSATVAPVRLDGEPVSAEIRADWEASAALAAEAAALNAALVQRASAVRDATGTRLARCATDRRAHGAYGRAASPRLVIADARA